MKNVFISSTFKDFQNERDILRNQVLPRLNQEAAKYGESVNFCDLRWGIDTSGMSEEESADRVLSVCLNEIERSRPYMIVLLGERYGFIPGEDSIKKELEKRTVELEELEISVTQLEIEYGSLQDSEALKHTFFFFRTISTENLPEEYLSESMEHARKLDVLKKRILKVAKDRVFFYEATYENDSLKNLDEFTEIVFKEVFQEFKVTWERYAQMSYYEKDHQIQWNYLLEKQQSFCAFEKEKNELIDTLKKSKQNVVALTGASGSGKSTMFSKICMEMKDAGWTVIPFLCGATAVSTNIHSILKSLIWQLEQKFLSARKIKDFELEQMTERELTDYLDELCLNFVQQGKKLLIAVDAVDQVDNVAGRADDISQELQFIPRTVSENVKVFFTYVKDCQCTRKMQIVDMPEMTMENQQLAVENILKYQGKILSAAIINQIIEKNTGKTPMYLYMCVMALVLMDADNFTDIEKKNTGIEAIIDEQKKIVEQLPDSIEELSVALLHMAVKRLGDTGLYNLAQFLAVSRHGLRENDLQILNKVMGYDFQPVCFYNWINFTSELFLLRLDGRFDYMHKCMREGILSLSSEKDVDVKIHNLYTYLKTLPENDPLKTQELIYHMVLADDQDGYLGYIKELMEKSDGQELYHAARETYQIALVDEGKWLSEFIRKKADIFMLDFVNWYLANMFGISDWEQAIYAQIMYAAEDRLSEILSEMKNGYIQKDYVSCYVEVYEAIGKICERKGQTEDLEEATEYFEKANSILNAIEKLVKGKLSEKLWELKYRCLKNLGRVFEKRGFDGVIRLGGKISISGLDENLHESEAYYEMSLEVAKGFEAEYANRKTVHMIAESYENIARLCAKNAGFFQDEYWRSMIKKKQFVIPEKVFEYYEKAKTYYLEAIKRNSESQNYRVKLAEADYHLNCARMHFLHDDAENLGIGAGHFEDALKNYEEVVRNDSSIKNQKLLADTYKEYARALKTTGHSFMTEVCNQMLENAIDVYEQLLESVYSEETMKQFEECTNLLAGNYRYGEEKHLDKALEIYVKKIKIYKILYEIHSSGTIRDFWIKAIENQTEVLKRIHDIKDFDIKNVDFKAQQDIKEEVVERISNLYQEAIRLSTLKPHDLTLVLNCCQNYADFLGCLGKKYAQKAAEQYSECVDVCGLQMMEQKNFSSCFKSVCALQKMAACYCRMETCEKDALAETCFEKSWQDYQESLKHLKGNEWTVIFGLQKSAKYLAAVGTKTSLKMSIRCLEEQYKVFPEVPINTSGDRDMICGHCKNVLATYEMIVGQFEAVISETEKQHCEKRMEEIDILYIEKYDKSRWNQPTTLERLERKLQCYLDNKNPGLLFEIRTHSHELARKYQKTGELENLIKAKDLLVVARKCCEEYGEAESISKRGFFLDDALCLEADAWMKIGGKTPSVQILEKALGAYNQALVVFEESRKYDQNFTDGSKGIDLKHIAALHMVLADILTQLNAYQEKEQLKKMIQMHYEQALLTWEKILKFAPHKNHSYNTMFCLDKLAPFYEKEEAEECYERIYNIAMLEIEKYGAVLHRDSLENVIECGKRALEGKKYVHKKMGMIYQMKNKRILNEQQERFYRACEQAKQAGSEEDRTERLGVCSALEKMLPAPEK